jgi:hypothetical protein
MNKDIISTIIDDKQRQRASELATQPGWNPDLAALAVLSGNEKAAVEAINSALKQAALGVNSNTSFGEATAKAEIAQLRQQIAEAKQQKDFRRLVSLKTHLYDRYGVGSI